MVCALLLGCFRRKCGRAAGAAKDEVRLVPLTDGSFVRQMESWMVTTRPRRREPLWPVTDETMRNWLKQAVKRAEADGVHFSIAVTPHTFRHSYIMHMLYHR
jgi:integrase